MHKRRFVEIFLTMTLSTMFIVGFSHFGASAYENYKGLGSFAENTMIGSINVSGKTKLEMEQILNEEINLWKKNTSIEIMYKEGKLKLDNDMFLFNIKETLSSIVSNEKHNIVVTLDIDYLMNQLEQGKISISKDKLNSEKLTEDLIQYASKLERVNSNVKLESYVLEEEASIVIAEAMIDIGESNQEMKKILAVIPSTIKLEGQSQFSLLKELGDHKVNEDALNRLATGLYRVILPTNFVIIERNISNELPEYAELGFEAYVNKNLNQDLVFSNINDAAYEVVFKKKENHLVVQLKGPTFLYKYEIKKGVPRKFAPKVIKQYSSKLSPSSNKVLEEGVEGMEIAISRKQVTTSGEVLDIEEISNDFYPPIHRIVVYGLQTGMPAESSIDNEEIINEEVIKEQVEDVEAEANESKEVEGSDVPQK